MTESEKGNQMGQVIQIDEARIKDHLGGMVRGALRSRLFTVPGNRTIQGPRECGGLWR